MARILYTDQSINWPDMLDGIPRAQCVCMGVGVEEWVSNAPNVPPIPQSMALIFLSLCIVCLVKF